MNNTVIKVLNKEHGHKVIEFWKSKCIDTRGYTGEVSEESGFLPIYYGVYNGFFSNYGESCLEDCDLIEL